MLIRSKFEGYARDGIRLYPGGGGGGPPPPDPRLVEAQINQMNIQAEAAQAIMGHANALAPLQHAQMQFGLHAAKTAFRDSREDRKYMLERRGHLTGLQDRMIGEAKEWDTPVMAEQMAGTAVADTETQLAGAEAARTRSMTRMGVNPTSGAFDANSNSMSLAKAGIKTAASNAGRTQARNEGRMLTDRAAGSLAGYPSMAMQTTGNSLTAGTAPLTIVNQGMAGLASGYNAAGATSAGAASTAANLYGTQQSAWNAHRQQQAQEEAGMWSAAGTVAGALIYASDRRVKKDIKKVGETPDGLGLYKFKYKGGEEMHIGVMAQEVEKVKPEAVSLKDGIKHVDYSKI